ncbi:TlyA family RNA methyltransferase [Naasia sp. SYSU D00057]|uniref:TlyA family RNA methyltransferase n=1 Tax=Naasia sp. SYSU D00057 TaxID=2817380 RepID=UPI001B300A42|nr:TlyA family RNA methyltransferase [Naasia sp. SYSU D00057]
MTDARLDAALVERGLARSRTHAARLIADGLVTVEGRPAVKPALRVPDGARIDVAPTDAYVSRAAHKLLAALDTFAVPVEGRLALDAGASTGGFTQVLLERGAERVIAVDVGHGQLVPELARDPRVDAHEGVNVRDLDPAALARLTGSDRRPDLVVADLSFISLTHVLPALVSVTMPDADFVVLIKPQFEVGRGGVKEGIVRGAGLRADAIRDVLWAAWDLGLGSAGLTASPIAGTNGNREYLAHLTTRAGDPSGLLEPQRLTRLTSEG